MKPLGQGGMATVWLAEGESTALRRKVALKIPYLAPGGMDAERFARERDILAQLNHPRIARLFDAGTASEPAQPYLVLEYVDGVPITTYCDRQRLTLAARIALFQQVLHAVQYAHNNLVVHRDLKPSNILVTPDGEAKLLDFGIARLLTEGALKESEVTLQGGRALTPEFASPEQLAGGVITTASDVYSLGVLLCELLTGERPYKISRDKPGSLEGTILRDDPIRPSQLAQDEERARARQSTAKKLSAALRGDLDTIVLKALRKDPEGRYASAAAFADDLESYLHGMPVKARPETGWYTARKFLLRHRLAAGSAVSVILALGAGFGIALYQADKARTQARKAEAVEAFLQDIFQANSYAHRDPVRARQTTARELLDLGSAKLDRDLADAPEAKLRVLATLAQLYADLGMKEQATAIQRKRIALARSSRGGNDPLIGEALVDLANGLGETRSVSELPAVIAEAERVLDANRDYTSRTRGFLYRAKERYYLDQDVARSVEEGRKAVEVLRGLPNRADLVQALDELGQSLIIHRDYPEAIADLTEAAAIAETIQGSARKNLPSIYAYLGNGQLRVLDMAHAEKNYRLAVETARAVNGEDHEDVVQTRQRLGFFLCETGRYREGLSELRAALELAIRIKGPNDLFHVGGTSRSYARKLIQFGRVEDGLALLAKTAELESQAHRTESRSGRDTLEAEAAGEIVLGRYQKAARLLRAAGSPKDRALTYARLELGTGQPQAAEQSLLGSAPEEARTGRLSLAWLQWTLAMAQTQLALGRNHEALGMATAARTRLEASPAASYWREYEAVADVVEARALLREERPAEALARAEKAAGIFAAVLDVELSPTLADAQMVAAECLARLGRTSDADAARRLAQAIQVRHKRRAGQPDTQ
ncbi:MAG: serine/threonine protein kinase [Acidobacteriota bacterium]|nr:serine/threonine protein kinase [Acidobacteriota bacterium]